MPVQSWPWYAASLNQGLCCHCVSARSGGYGVPPYPLGCPLLIGARSVILTTFLLSLLTLQMHFWERNQCGPLCLRYYCWTRSTTAHVSRFCSKQLNIVPLCASPRSAFRVDKSKLGGSQARLCAALSSKSKMVAKRPPVGHSLVHTARECCIDCLLAKQFTHNAAATPDLWATPFRIGYLNVGCRRF